MTDQQHPITPPPELVQRWWDGTHGAFYEFEAVTTQAARWGADQELEACCEWVSQWRCMVGGSRPEVGLRAARRPKPLSLARAATLSLSFLREDLERHGMDCHHSDDFSVIRRALERLQELEGQGDG